MRFACESCLTRYTLADEKVQGRVLKIRCKNCGTVMVVRDPALAQPEPATFGDEATRTLSASEAMRLAAAAGAAAPSAFDQVGGPPAEPAWDEQATRTMDAAEAQRLARAEEPGAEWYAMRNGEQLGPMSRDELAMELASGGLTARNYVWREGMGDWQRLEGVDELVALLPAATAPAAALPVAAEEPPVEEAPPVEEGPLDPAALFSGNETESTPAEPTPAVPAPAAAPKPSAPAAPGWTMADAGAPRAAPGRAATATAPAKEGTGSSRVVRLVAAGVILAALFAAAAFFLLPAAPASAPAPSEATGAAATGSGPVRLGAIDLPAGASLAGNAVRSALATRLPGYSRCVLDHTSTGNRPGSVTVRAVVAPTGVVTTASVADGGGELGVCLADRTRDVRFPAFEGEPLELTVPLVIAGK
ncbi:GYF domain-containing protein [Vulgatibacter sp.]|uniref:GYF domain-containing protein n=1 Tax=Vulgatibacter sp. TaxID=1971226 RepID=UPI003562A512